MILLFRDLIKLSKWIWGKQLMRQLYLSIILASLFIFIFLCGCDSEVGVQLDKINRNNPEYFLITDNQFREYPLTIQNAILSNGTVTITTIEKENFINTSRLHSNKILICGNQNIDVFEGYIEYTNNTYFTFFECDPVSNNLTQTFVLLKNIAVNIDNQELMKVPTFNKIIQSTKLYGSLPRNEWDTLRSLVSAREFKYLFINSTFYEIKFTTT
jgi:hypothetical protein